MNTIDIMLVLLTLTSPYGFELKVVDHYKTEAECMAVFKRIPGELRIYHACLNTSKTIPNKEFYDNLRKRSELKGKAS